MPTYKKDDVAEFSLEEKRSICLHCWGSDYGDCDKCALQGINKRTYGELQQQLEAANQLELGLLAVIEKQRNAIVLALNKVTCDPSLQIVATLEDALEYEPSQALRELELLIAAEAWRWGAKSSQDDANEPFPEMPEHCGELIIANVMAEERRKK